MAPPRLPVLASSLHQSSSSTAPAKLESSTALVLPTSAPIFKSRQFSDGAEGPALGIRPGKKWLLEPVLANGEDRWLSRPGAPPRRYGLLPTTDSMALATASPAPAVEAADSELVASQTSRVVQPPQSCQVRLPRVPRMASRRTRSCAPGLKALAPARSTAKQILELGRLSSTEVMEARYTRDLAGRQSAFWRSTLDQDIANQDVEFAAMADYRQAAAFYYQHRSRDKANAWRETSARQQGLSEWRWKLQQGLMEISRKAPGDDLDRHNAASDLDDFAMPPVPRSSPCEPPKMKGGRPTIRGNRKKRRASNVTLNEIHGGAAEGVPQEGFEEADSEDDDENDNEKKAVNKLKNSSLKLKQPLRLRLRRVRRNGREHRQGKGKGQAPTSPAQSLSPAPPSPSKKTKELKNKAAAFFNSASSSKESSSSEEEEEESENEDVSDLPNSTKPLLKVRVEHRASQVAAFMQWNERDQLALRRVFERYDANHNDTLDQSELTDCLADLGLRGRNEFERNEIRCILWSINKLEVGFYEFATQVVPSIRGILTALQQDRMRSAFEDADTDGSGMLSLEEALKQLRLMGTFPSENQVKEAICQICPEASEIGRTLDGSWLTTRDILNFDKFGALIRLLHEISERERADRTRQLILEFSLDDEEKEAWQHTLVDMHNVFCRCGAVIVGGRHVVAKSNASIVVRECGLAPRNTKTRLVISTVVNFEADEEGNVDFKALLRIGTRLREHDRQWLHKMFHKHDYNRSGGLSLTEVHGALIECGIRSRNNQETAEIRILIEEFDEDGSGECEQDEFVNLFRFVAQKLHRVQRETERQTAVRFGWSDKHFDELRGTFMALDQDASESLEMDEMLQAVENLQHSFKREDMNIVLQEVEVPEGSKFDFLAFMKIMKALEDKEAQRLVAKRHGFEGEVVNRLRAAFRDLAPNDECMISREGLKNLLVDAYSESLGIFAEMQRELLASHPPKVNFDVFVKFMKKKMDVGIRRRSSVCIAD